MEAPLYCNTESPYTQLDNVLHFLFFFFTLQKYISILSFHQNLTLTLTFLYHQNFDLPLCPDSLVARRGGKTRARGCYAAGVLQVI